MFVIACNSCQPRESVEYRSRFSIQPQIRLPDLGHRRELGGTALGKETPLGDHAGVVAEGESQVLGDNLLRLVGLKAMVGHWRFERIWHLGFHGIFLSGDTRWRSKRY
jgi:hypothetical protein